MERKTNEWMKKMRSKMKMLEQTFVAYWGELVTRWIAVFLIERLSLSNCHIFIRTNFTVGIKFISCWEFQYTDSRSILLKMVWWRLKFIFYKFQIKMLGMGVSTKHGINHWIKTQSNKSFSFTTYQQQRHQHTSIR